MKWILGALLFVGCARSTDAMNGGNRDLSAIGGNGASGDLGSSPDLAPDPTSVSDLAAPPDLGPPPDLTAASDLARPPDLTPMSDLAQSSSDVTVHVLIDNFCNSSTNPTVINAPLHVALHLTFVNDSHDYDADIWSSSNYGYLGLAQGGVWHDPIDHCLNPNPYTEYFDVGIAGGPVGGACPSYRLQIHCN
jgi:hypothetical protein